MRTFTKTEHENGRLAVQRMCESAQKSYENGNADIYEYIDYVYPNVMLLELDEEIDPNIDIFECIEVKRYAVLFDGHFTFDHTFEDAERMLLAIEYIYDLNDM